MLGAGRSWARGRAVPIENSAAGMRALSELVRQRIGTGGGEAYCATAVTFARDELFGRFGVRLTPLQGRSLDDLSVHGGIWAGWGRPATWPRVAGWAEIGALIGAEPGRVAFVLAGRPGSYGHAFLVVHTTDGLLTVDPSARAEADRVRLFAETPDPPLMSGGDLRVRVFAADGTAVTTPAPPQESATATGNLTDFAELRYRGSGVEDEQSVMLFFDDDAGDVTELRTEVLAFGPGYRVEVETKFFYLGPDDRFYVTEQEAKAAGGSGEAVMAGMIERVSSVMRAHPHEAGRVDPAPVFDAFKRMAALADRIPGPDGGGPVMPLSEFLAGERVNLSFLGEMTTVGRQPVGEVPGSGYHYTHGFVLSGMWAVLQHIRDNTFRTSPEFLTQDFLTDGLAFGAALAERFRQFVQSRGYPALLDVGRAIREVAGYSALFYCNFAGITHRFVTVHSPDKRNIAVLSRTESFFDLLLGLPEAAQDFFAENLEGIWTDLELRYRARVPAFDARFRERRGDDDGRAITLADLPITTDEEELTTLRDYVLNAFDRTAGPVFQADVLGGVTTVPPDAGPSGLLVPHAVVEVRSYGARRVSAEQARFHNETLTRLANNAYEEALVVPASVRAADSHQWLAGEGRGWASARRPIPAWAETFPVGRRGTALIGAPALLGGPVQDWKENLDWLRERLDSAPSARNRLFVSWSNDQRLDRLRREHRLNIVYPLLVEQPPAAAGDVPEETRHWRVVTADNQVRELGEGELTAAMLSVAFGEADAAARAGISADVINVALQTAGPLPQTPPDLTDQTQRRESVARLTTWYGAVALPAGLDLSSGPLPPEDNVRRALGVFAAVHNRTDSGGPTTRPLLPATPDELAARLGGRLIPVPDPHALFLYLRSMPGTMALVRPHPSQATSPEVYWLISTDDHGVVAVDGRGKDAAGRPVSPAVSAQDAQVLLLNEYGDVVDLTAVLPAPVSLPPQTQAHSAGGYVDVGMHSRGNRSSGQQRPAQQQAAPLPSMYRYPVADPAPQPLPPVVRRAVPPPAPAQPSAAELAQQEFARQQQAMHRYQARNHARPGLARNFILVKQEAEYRSRIETLQKRLEIANRLATNPTERDPASWLRQAEQHQQSIDSWRAEADRWAAAAAQSRAYSWEQVNEDDGELVPHVPISTTASLRPGSQPRAIDESRQYDQAGGLRRPLLLHQRMLEHALREEHGGFVLNPRPTTTPGSWFTLINDGGPTADPTRAINCADCTLSFLDTWNHGRPRVSAPRTFDGYREGSTRPDHGEIAAVRRLEAIGGANGYFQLLTAAHHDGSRYLQRTAQQLKAAVDHAHLELTNALLRLGHSSAAIVVSSDMSGTSHAWVAINQDGQVLFLDPQMGLVQTTPLLGYDSRSRTHSVEALVLDNNARQVLLPGRPRGFVSQGMAAPQPQLVQLTQSQALPAPHALVLPPQDQRRTTALMALPTRSATPLPTVAEVGGWTRADARQLLGAVAEFAVDGRPVVAVDLAGAPEAIVRLEHELGERLQEYRRFGVSPLVLATSGTVGAISAFARVRDTHRPVVVREVSGGLSGQQWQLEYPDGRVDQDTDLYRVLGKAAETIAVPAGPPLPPVLAGWLHLRDWTAAEAYHRDHETKLNGPGVREALRAEVAAFPEDHRLGAFLVALAVAGRHGAFPAVEQERLVPVATSMLHVEPAYEGGSVPPAFVYDYLATRGTRRDRLGMDGLLFQLLMAGALTGEEVLTLAHATAETTVDRANVTVLAVVAGLRAAPAADLAGDLSAHPLLAALGDVTTSSDRSGCVDPVDRVAWVGRLDAWRDSLRAAGGPDADLRAQVVDRAAEVLSNC
ncbi:toxin glutamine deamidase domain-containing protein [Catenuloplanes japonicus]|uniref:toxin glutamine deamidase domain-containing protein n=1 Tax=Catenuloplanes japonicus TaxID=33876 RepID=UPI0012F9D538|nr:toxin glutamine deamidase domain-containing protein [Catenuloplanes japonicus]